MENNQLPADVQSRIEADAVQSDVKNMNKNWEYRTGYREGYIAGATAERERAQVLAEALVLARAEISPLIEPALWNKAVSPEQRSLIKTRNTIDNALQQWKGEGKEVGDG